MQCGSAISTDVATTRRVRAVGPPTVQGSADVIADFNGQIEGLETADVAAMLASVQTNMQAALDSAG